MVYIYRRRIYRERKANSRKKEERTESKEAMQEGGVKSIGEREEMWTSRIGVTHPGPSVVIMMSV